MSYLKDYLLYNEGNECGKTYHVWAALVAISATVSRRVFVSQGYFKIHTNLYVCLVGKSGNRKTTARDICYELLKFAIPNLTCTAESTSKEQICKFLAGEPQLRTFKNSKGEIIEYRPITMFPTEMKNFLAIDPIGMINFLTAIFDRSFYDYSTKNKGTDVIVNPYVVLLGCDVPEWLTENLKKSVISGGFCRRIVFVWPEDDQDNQIARPVVTDEARAAWQRCANWLKGLSEIQGEFVWDDDAGQFFDQWYPTRQLDKDDPLMAGYYKTKDSLLLKLAMLIALSETHELRIQKKYLELGLGLLAEIEPNMKKLSQSVGRNDLAFMTNKVLDIVKTADGAILEKELKRMTYKDFQVGGEFEAVINHLTTTDQLFKVRVKRGDSERVFLVLFEHRKAIEAKLQQPLAAGGTSNTLLTSPL